MNLKLQEQETINGSWEVYIKYIYNKNYNIMLHITRMKCIHFYPYKLFKLTVRSSFVAGYEKNGEKMIEPWP